MFKFTIRETIMMTAVVAVLIALWTERQQNMKASERVVTRLAALESRMDALNDAFTASLKLDWSLPITVPATPGTKLYVHRPGHLPGTVYLEALPAKVPPPFGARKPLAQPVPPPNAPIVRPPISN